jgi:thioredoxin 1
MSDTTQKGARHLTAEDFQTTVDDAKKAGIPVFVDFYADWCGPCQIAAPVVDKLAGEYDGKAIIAKLNVDDHNSIAGQYGVMSIPTVIVINDGEEVDRKIGFPGEAGYREMLDKVVKAA